MIFDLFDFSDSVLTYDDAWAVFEGEDPRNVTSYLYTPNGTRYAACTFIYHYYAPAANAATVTVEPHSTQVVAASNMTTTEDGVEIDPPKPPAQMQKEAEQGGGLSVWHEWSWWYPWYRLHVKVHVNPTIDVGFNPILPGGEVAEWNGLEFFSSLGSEVVQLIAIEAFGLIGTYLLAKYASIGSFLTGIAIEIVKILIQVGFLSPSWNSAEAMLASALMSTIMMVFVITDFSNTVSSCLVRLIDGLKWICGGAVTALTWVLVKLKDMFLWGRGASSAIVDVMEIVADAVLGVIALRRYNQLIHGA